MAKKKIRIGEKRRLQIRENFEKIKPSKLTAGELLYYNKVKAGKARQKSAFRDKAGQFSAVPQKIIDNYVKPVLKELNPDYTPEDLKRHIKENKDLLRDITDNESIRAFYQNKNIENALLNTNDLTKFYIDDGDGLRAFSKDKMIEKLKRYEQKVFKGGAFGFYTKVDFKKGFTEMIVYLPYFDDFEDIEADDDFKLIMSDPKNKKKKNAATKKAGKNKN